MVSIESVQLRGVEIMPESVFPAFCKVCAMSVPESAVLERNLGASLAQRESSQLEGESSQLETHWIRDARHAISKAPVDFFRVKASRYWIDFLASLVFAYSFASLYLMAPLGSTIQWIAFPIAVFWLYRLGSLVHEVCHLGQHEMPLFKLTWNLLVGVMTFTPSPFFTRHHRDHHSLRVYGTHEDPEYVANVLKSGNFRSLICYLILIIAFPIIVFLRFLLVPLSYLHPKLRQFVLERASSLTLNFQYRRKLNEADRRSITIMEWLCFVRALAIPATVLVGVAPLSRIPLIYLLGLATFALNQLRQLADHHFEGDGSRVNVESHILDSCNFTGNDLLTRLFFPFSIRYHNLKSAHRYLLEVLPSNSPYRELDERNWWGVAKKTLFGVSF
jgi:fatty acid desaturase